MNLSLAARHDEVFFLLTLAAALADAYGDYDDYNEDSTSAGVEDDRIKPFIFSLVGLLQLSSFSQDSICAGDVLDDEAEGRYIVIICGAVVADYLLVRFKSGVLVVVSLGACLHQS